MIEEVFKDLFIVFQIPKEYPELWRLNRRIIVNKPHHTLIEIEYSQN